ncbi:MAG: PIN domain-containing protein [Chitinophagaceae bacterium]
MIAVIDTNLMLQAIGKTSIHKPIWQGIVDEKYSVVVSSAILLEYEEILALKASTLAADLVQKVFFEAANIEHINPEFLWDAVPDDKDDNKFFGGSRLSCYKRQPL